MAITRPLSLQEKFLISYIFGIPYMDIPTATINDFRFNDPNAPANLGHTVQNGIYMPPASNYYRQDYFQTITNNPTKEDWDAAAVFIHEYVHVLQNANLIISGPSTFPASDNYNYILIFEGDLNFYLLSKEAQAEFIQDYFLRLFNQQINPIKDITNPSESTIGNYNHKQYTEKLPPDFLAAVNSTGPWVSKPPGQWAKELESIFGRTATDPIILDLDGGGVTLTHIDESSAQFDLHNTGFAVDNGWIGSGEGFLVRDLNNNGVIDNITELFGNSSLSGFAALGEIDSNNDGKITSADAAWSDLKVWVDANGNGVTDSGELQSLAYHDIVEIDLNSSPVDMEVNGNIIAEIASFKYANNTTGQVAEAYFQNSRMNSTFTGNYTLNPEVLFLPSARSYRAKPVNDNRRLCLFLQKVA